MNIKEIISLLTLEEKAQLLAGDANMLTHAVERLNIPAKSLADGPHGVRHTKEENCTSFPNLCCAGATFDTDLLYEMGQALAKDCIEHDVDMLLGPGINIKRYAKCGRNFEYLSEDPIVAGELGAAYINGIESLGVATSLKHFALNNQEKDRTIVSVEVDERTLREIYLKGFEIAVKKSQPTSVMCAYNKHQSIWCSENKHLLNDILKEEWGFNGFVISDWGAVQNVGRAIAAGLDLQMPYNKKIVEEIKTALDDGTLSEERMNNALERFLTFVFSKKNQKGDYNRDELHAVARKVAANGTVLLKNNNDVLPITKEKYKTIGIVGEYGEAPLSYGYGSAEVYADDKYIESPIEELKKALPNCNFVYQKAYEKNGYPEPLAFRSRASVFTALNECDIILVFVGCMETEDAEFFDKRTIELERNQEMLIEAAANTGKKVVVICQSGSAMILGKWRHRVDGIIQMWLGGEAAGGGIADVLTGTVNPSGRLPETFPTKERLDIDTGNGLVARYTEGLEVGYRYYDTHTDEIVYPFGHGLSYTTFEYSNASVTKEADNINVTFTLKNTGEVDGAEIVQLYSAKPLSCVTRVPKELKAFKKVYLKAGEEKEITISLAYKELSYFNPALNDWVVEPGDYKLYIAASSRDIRLSLDFKAEEKIPYTMKQINESMVG